MKSHAAIQRRAREGSKTRTPASTRPFADDARAPVQPKAARAGHDFARMSVHPDVLRPSAGGSPLPATVQAKMEAALGHDFSGVRVHQGPEAASIGAVAFTRGTHIHFRPGAYAPHQAAGQRLLGHELTHVVQQRAGRVRSPGGRALPVNDDARLEREADAHGARAARGEPSGASGAGRPTATGTGAIQAVWVKLSNGKVEYDWSKDESDRPSAEHTWMEKDEFTTWKNSGKRTGSNKWSDPASGKKYFSGDGSSFYDDPAMKKKSATQPDPKNLWDRRRADRTSSPIALWDIAPYSVAKGKETRGDQMEHDHVLAGESKKRGWAKQKAGSFKIPDPTRSTYLSGFSSGEQAYNAAPSIEIRGTGHPEGWDHRMFSPTWGSGRQSAIDHATFGGKKYTMDRPDMDAELPGAAFHRDVDTMLTHSPVRADALAQSGAYRKMYRTNVQEGILNPAGPAFTMTGNALANKNDGGGVAYTEITGKTQGPLTDAMLMGHTAKRVSKPGGTPSTATPMATTTTSSPLVSPPLASPSVPSPIVSSPLVPSPMLSAPMFPSPSPMLSSPLFPSPSPMLSSPLFPSPSPMLSSPLLPSPSPMLTSPSPMLTSPISFSPPPVMMPPSMPVAPLLPSPMLTTPPPTTTSSTPTMATRLKKAGGKTKKRKAHQQVLAVSKVPKKTTTMKKSTGASAPSPRLVRKAKQDALARGFK